MVVVPALTLMLNLWKYGKRKKKKFMQIVTQWPGFMDILCIDELIFYSDMMAKNWEIRRTHSLK